MVTNYGEGRELHNRGVQVLPRRKGGSKKVLAMLKGDGGRQNKF